jgi:hypothetical protein
MEQQYTPSSPQSMEIAVGDPQIIVPRPRLNRQQIEAAALNLAEADAGAQFDLLATIACDFRRGIPAAKAEGITPDCFQDDLQLIYCGFEVGAEDNLDLPRTLAVIKAALAEGGFWDKSQLADNMVTSCLWSDAKLELFCGLWFFCESAIRERSQRLLHIISRIALIDRLGKSLMAAYEDANTEIVGSPKAPTRNLRPAAKSTVRLIGIIPPRTPGVRRAG